MQTVDRSAHEKKRSASLKSNHIKLSENSKRRRKQPEAILMLQTRYSDLWRKCSCDQKRRRKVHQDYGCMPSFCMPKCFLQFVLLSPEEATFWIVKPKFKQGKWLVAQNAHHKSVDGKSTMFTSSSACHKRLSEEAGEALKKFMCCTLGECMPIKTRQNLHALHGRRQTSAKISRL